MEIDPAMWLNSVRAVPSVGLKFRTSFDTPSTLVSRLKPLLAKWQTEFDVLNVGIEKDFAVKIERSDGVEVKLTHDQLAVRYFYLSKLVERGLPQAVVKYQSERKSFVELCELLNGVITEVVAELSKDGNKTLVRVGVVADGNLDPDALPPGFEMYLKHLASPWDSGLVFSNSTLLARLGESDDILDRCHHVVETPIDEEDDTSVITFKLDWQRLWKHPEPVSPAKIRVAVADAVGEALAYFGTFGVGELNYANDK